MPSPASRTSKAKPTAPKAQDAIALLKADHREAEGVFEQFEKARSPEKKGELAMKVCKALRVHMTIEEEIFYPAFKEATGDDDAAGIAGESGRYAGGQKTDEDR